MLFLFFIFVVSNVTSFSKEKFTIRYFSPTFILLFLFGISNQKLFHIWTEFCQEFPPPSTLPISSHGGCFYLTKIRLPSYETKYCFSPLFIKKSNICCLGSFIMIRIKLDLSVSFVSDCVEMTCHLICRWLNQTSFWVGVENTKKYSIYRVYSSNNRSWCEGSLGDSIEIEFVDFSSYLIAFNLIQNVGQPFLHRTPPE